MDVPRWIAQWPVYRQFTGTDRLGRAASAKSTASETQLFDAVAPTLDNIRIYQLPPGTFTTARHLGAATMPTHHGPLVL